MFKISSAIIAALLVLTIGVTSVFSDAVQVQLNKINMRMKDFVVSVMSQLMNVQKDEKEADPWTPLRKEEPEAVKEDKQSEAAEPENDSKAEAEKKPEVKKSTASKPKKTWVPWVKPASTPAITEEKPEDASGEAEDNENTEMVVPETEIAETPADITESDSNENEESSENIIYGETINVVIPPNGNSDTTSGGVSDEISGAE